MSGFIADLVAVNPRLLQEVERRLKGMEHRSAAGVRKAASKAAGKTRKKWASEKTRKKTVGKAASAGGRRHDR